MKEIEQYFESVSEDKKFATRTLFETILHHIPTEFEAAISYKMPSFVVPFNIYPNGYHCNTKLELPFISIAAQKNFIALYHMGIYADESLKNWFEAEYPRHCKSKLDMGKSCIRFKKPEDIPFELIGELVSKMSVDEWIAVYEKNFLKK